MFPKPPPRRNSNEHCALEIKNEGIAYAHILRPQQNATPVILKEYGFYSGNDSPEQIATNLNLIANKYHCKDIDCNWVLSPKYYRLLLTNAPKVPPNEYKDALRWQIKDMVDYPLDDIALDTFAPPGFSQIDPPKLYVIITRASFLQKISQLIKQTGFNLKTIDTKEFAVRNLITSIPNLTYPIVFLHFIGKECLLAIVKNNYLYFVRYIPMNHNIQQTTPEQTSIKIGNEIQKSLDYYTNELKQEMPTEFLLSPTITPDNQFISIIKKNIPINISSLAMESIIQTENKQPLEPELIKTCCAAIGGALRQDEE